MRILKGYVSVYKTDKGFILVIRAYTRNPIEIREFLKEMIENNNINVLVNVSFSSIFGKFKALKIIREIEEYLNYK